MVYLYYFLVLLSFSSVIITENDINNLNTGIYLGDSSADIHFNRITGNSYGLQSGWSICNATNNWWGTNNPVVSSNEPSDIYISGGTVFYDPWLVLTVTPTSYKVINGKIYESTVTANLNHNNRGEYILTLMYVPDGIPVTFTTDGGTINSTGYTKNGEASSTLILDPNLQYGLTNVNALLDGQSVSTTVDRIANAIIYINSTAIDLSTDMELSLTYILPLNESVSWVSVLWKSNSTDFGSFQNEVSLIVNGEVVLTRTVVNPKYLYYRDRYSPDVLYYINFLNWLFSNSTYSRTALKSIVDSNPHLQGLTGTALEAGILNLIRGMNDFNGEEMQLIGNYKNFTDVIETRIFYPGDASKRITIEDPDSGELMGLDFGGNPISRASTMIYVNGGYRHAYGDINDPDSYLYKYAGYEDVRSFAIVITKVTDEILQYWLDQKDRTDANGVLLYPDGPMKAAYGTFLSALLMIKAHDMVADQAAAEFNVTWSRTTPIVVSAFDDAYLTILTLECDHRFGMDVVGDPQNVVAFVFACSVAINPLEHMVWDAAFPNGNTTGITGGLGQMILNGELVDMFMSNGYFVIKSADNRLFLVVDPESGLVRDVRIGNGTVSGSWCFSDQQTEWIFGHGWGLLNNLSGLFNSISKYSVYMGAVVGTLAEVAIWGGVTVGGVSLGGLAMFSISALAPIAFLEVMNPHMIEQAERDGNFNAANWYRQSFVDRMKDTGRFNLVDGLMH